MDWKMTKLTDAQIKEWLEPVEDPELFLSLVGLGLIYDCQHDDDGVVVIKLTLTSPSCPLADQLIDKVKVRAKEHESIKDVIIEVVWEPKWDPKTMASEEVKDVLGLW